jgi:hypothetical protein
MLSKGVNDPVAAALKGRSGLEAKAQRLAALGLPPNQKCLGAISRDRDAYSCSIASIGLTEGS